MTRRLFWLGMVICAAVTAGMVYGVIQSDWLLITILLGIMIISFGFDVWLNDRTSRKDKQ